MKIFRVIFLFVFMLIVIAAVFLESNPGKRIVENAFLNMIAKSGMDVQVGTISGNLPYHIDLHNVSLDGTTAENVHIQISLIHLLKRELFIRSFKADGIQLSSAMKNGTNSEKIAPKQMPLNIVVKSFELKSEDLEVRGEAKLRRNGSGFLDAIFTNPKVKDSKLNAELSWDKNSLLELSFNLKTPTLKAFDPWIKLEEEGSLKLQGWARGFPDQFNGKINGRFDAQKMPIPELERNWLIKSRIQKPKNGPIEFQKILVSSAGLRYQGSIALDANNHFAKGDGEIRAELAQGLVFLNGEVKQEPNGIAANIHWKSDNLISSVHQASGDLQGLWANNAFIGETTATGNYLDETWVLKTPVAVRPDTSILFETIELESPLLKANGEIAIRLPEKIPSGRFEICKANLELIQRWDHSIPVTGQVSGDISFDQGNIYGTLHGKEIYYKTIRIPTIRISKDALSLQACAANIQVDQLLIHSVIYSQVDDMYQLESSGTYKYPLELQSNGTVTRSGNNWTIHATTLSGSLNEVPIKLNNPVDLKIAPESYSISQATLKYGTGSIALGGEYNPQKIDANLFLNAVPLDILSFNPLEIPVSGKLYFDGAFRQEGGKTSGHLKGSIKKGKIEIEGVQDPIKIQGDIDANLIDERLNTIAYVQVNEKPLLSIDSNLPFEMDRLNITVSGEKKAFAHLSLHGKAEDVLDFFNLGTHRIEGNVDGEFRLKGTLNRPQIVGACEITNGHYENYQTGTELIDLSAHLVGKDNQLVLTSLTAHDPCERGTLSATGTIQISAREHCPFHFDLDFQDLSVVQIDLVSTVANGNIRVKGDLKGALAKGNAELSFSEVAIPDKIPRSLPDLPVVYKNRPKFLYVPKELKAPYPLALELKVKAPESIHIDGRGLHTVWAGDFLVGGTTAAPLLQGKLSLLSGDFSFSGKQFALVDGEISMKGKPYELPHIDISANTHEGGISITARILGPINRPQITFQSTPPLPLSGILSYLLFGKDLSDVSGAQAIQLAATAAAVAGEGPDILEMTRKSLGVDRIQIVTTPGSHIDGADTLALEIGKVIYPGFMVTVRQGAEDSTPSFGVQVELGKGFTLGLENQQQPEQGKFSLNWNLNY